MTSLAKSDSTTKEPDPSKADRTRRRIVWLKRLLKTGGLMVLAMALLLLWARVAGTMELNRVRKEILAAGEKLTVDELRPPAASSEQNGAEEFLDAAKRSTNLNEIVLLRPPVLTMISPGRARSALSMLSWQDMSPTNKLSWNDLAAALQKTSLELTAVKNAVRKPRLYYGSRYLYGALNLGLLPHLEPMRLYALWLSASALENMHAHQLDAALDDLEAIHLLGEKFTEDKLILTHQVSLFAEKSGLAVVWEILQTKEWNDAQLERLQKIFSKSQAWPVYANNLEMERNLMFDRLEKARQGDADAAEWIGYRDSGSYSPPEGLMALFGIETKPTDSGSSKVWAEMLSGVWENWQSDVINHGILPLWCLAGASKSEAICLRQSQEMIGTARTAKDRRTVRVVFEWESQFETQIKNAGALDFYLWQPTRLEATFFLGYSLQVAQFETWREMVVTAVALERFKLRRGEYPSALQEMVPELLASLPTDYMNGSALHYRKQPDGSFLLYSVGENGTDEGGNPKALHNNQEVSLWNALDVVWPQKATAAEVKAYEETK